MISKRDAHLRRVMRALAIIDAQGCSGFGGYYIQPFLITSGL